MSREDGTSPTLCDPLDTSAPALCDEDVLAAASHDLRNPLNVIGLTTALLIRTLPENATPALRQQYELIERSVRTMNRVIDELTDMAAIQDGHQPLALEPCPADGLLEEVAARQESAAQDRSVALCFGFVCPSLTVHCDRQRLLQVFDHLVTHALKVADPGGSVSCEVDAEPAQAVFTLTGSGAHHEGYRPATVAPAARAHRRSLGLHLSQAIIAAHGGRFWLEQVCGTDMRLRFTLPRAV